MIRLLAICLLGLVGCATVTVVPATGAEKVPEGSIPLATVEISNTVWEFLTVLPVASGDVDNPNGWGCSLFRDTETLENQLKMLDAEAKRIGATRAVNVSTLSTAEELLLIAFLRESLHTTAVLIK